LNELVFSELSLGQRAELEFAVTADLVRSFVQLSGDRNPLHVDDAHARGRGFLGVVAHGMLVASFVSTLVGHHLPGKHALLHGVKLSFLQPVLVGDMVRLLGEITHLNEAHRQMEMKVTFTNQHDVRVARGTVQVGVHE
jgi:acyl dehydratase